MAHAVLDEPKLHMGLPLPHGKLALWLFLVTEIMFFTGLIGTYIILRNGTPSTLYPWPRPHDVHLAEWAGAVNTFVLICSSLSVVLCHFALAKGQVKRATQYMAITLALGCVFLGIKAYEYYGKISHDILPGRIFERLDGDNGRRYVFHVEKQLKHIVDEPEHHGATADAKKAWDSFKDEAGKKNKEVADFTAAAEKKRTEAVDKIKKEMEKAAPSKLAEAVNAEFVKTEKEVTAKKAEAAEVIEKQRKAVIEKNGSIAAVADSWALLQKLPSLTPKQLNLEVMGTQDIDDPAKPNEHVKPCDEVKGYKVDKGLLQKHPDLHVSYAISFGNLWASCYFAMTGFHAIHVLGGLVVFVIILIMAARGTFQPRHEALVEYTGLYWHFVDIVWIFLFPLLYLV
ncbi:MAG TPA: cytochrome c oxidase subunit 3 [Gemmataceae bacterium]|nr:cytochrome c oxidase subunit 3 [Gemmataceae bacterium]